MVWVSLCGSTPAAPCSLVSLVWLGTWVGRRAGLELERCHAPLLKPRRSAHDTAVMAQPSQATSTHPGTACLPASHDRAAVHHPTGGSPTLTLRRVSRIGISPERCRVRRVAPASALTHARILLKANQGEAGPGWTDAAIGAALEVNPATVARAARRCAWTRSAGRCWPRSPRLGRSRRGGRRGRTTSTSGRGSATSSWSRPLAWLAGISLRAGARKPDVLGAHRQVDVTDP